MNIDIHHGDCREIMATLDAESVDAVVCDPPYGLSFMGKGWDHGVPGVEFWTEALRVAKPGAHLLAFGGTRTYHRLACAIEDAGWEIRDCVMWVYGSGFPKSLDVSKAIDKCNGQPNRLHKFTAWMRTTGLTARQLDEITGTNMGGHYLTAASQPAIPTAALWELIRPHCGDVPAWVDELVQRIEAEREVIGHRDRGFAPGTNAVYGDYSGDTRITAPATDSAQQWSGWGTALKPAWEPIIVARKPLIGTVAENVLTHGTGGINVDGCRVGATKDVPASESTRSGYMKGWNGGHSAGGGFNPNVGRWPANLIHDGSDEVVGLFPNVKAGVAVQRNRDGGVHNAIYGAFRKPSCDDVGFADSGSAARFFYCAKASRADRGDDNRHPTVKPTALMRYLCRLVTPPGGVVLDPFAGSGSTGKAAILEGFRFIGIERDAEYVEIAKARIAAAVQKAEAVA